MKNIMIVVGGINHNKGSEALVRGLVSIIKRKYPDSLITVALYGEPTETAKNMPGVDCFINRKSYKYKYSVRNIAGKGLWTLGFKNLSVRVRSSSKIFDHSQKQDLIIVIAADNYDQSYGNSGEILHIENTLYKSCSRAKFCLYDCSLEKSHIDENIKADVALSDVFTVRESLTLQNFSEHFPKEKIHYYPDPAFVMEPEETHLPQGWEDGVMVGINLSNLILSDKYVAGRDKILVSYYNLVEYIIKDTSFKIVLIPHVMNNEDLPALSVLYEKYKDTGRVILINNQNLMAPQLKYIISKCRLYIGARTHSTIAAYSSHIPTLVLGYSIKSLGIAQDLFGATENYVISSQNLSDEMELANRFKWIVSNEDEIKKHLEKVMPDYVRRVWDTADVL